MKTSNKVLFGGLAAIFFTIVLLALLGRTTAEVKTKVDCDGDPKIVKELNFEFESISVSQNIEVQLSQGDDFKVQLEASEQIVEIVNHYVEDGVLNLGFEDRKGKPCTTVFRIQCPTLKSATVANGGRILTNGTFTVPDLQLQASNGSSITMDLVSDNVSVKVMNGSNIAVEGQTKNLDVNASNSSSVDAAKISISNATMSLANSSSAVIKSDTIASANVVNSSSLQYIGETQLQDVRSVNSSSISKRGE